VDSEIFHVDAMLRADWQTRRLQRVEADLYRSVLAESPGASLAAALLSDSPAAKLLARVQRQLAAFERAWYRANSELRRARRQAEADSGQSFDNYLDFLCAKPAPGELASLHQSAHNGLPDSPAALLRPATGRQPTKKPAGLCASSADSLEAPLAARPTVILGGCRPLPSPSPEATRAVAREFKPT
jgi:hypothetical protein